MTTTDNAAQQDDDPARVARGLLRQAGRATLATVMADGGGPYASLVMVATDLDGTPILLLSDLAAHSQNIAADPRVSLLIDGTAGYAPPLTGPRASIIGRIARTDAAQPRRRYLARHPDASGYAEFSDFSFYRLDIERAHLVAGFGRIVWVDGADLLLPAAAAAACAEWETGVVEHMNADHRDALDLYATVLLGATGEGWHMGGCDPEGCDLGRDGELLRLTFSTPVQDATGVRKELVRLVQQARERQAGKP